MEDQFVEGRKKEKETVDAYGRNRRNDQMVSENRKNEHRCKGKNIPGLLNRIACKNSTAQFLAKLCQNSNTNSGSGSGSGPVTV